ncbi:amino acid/amide ABC transporter ATP-binding protein 2, HAAT family [Alteribacillus iranensis]|uniref:Amino acid/amide ABC transporter ATP-binding protein 2, HAAT family n=2 Tax=Alteribacillus iranensis TaxID=930128 RepID=A0A1I2EKN7_9BACI|nr:amino acid/amide ABC transporter ATP-binding protein 2, HAAT family [Alteribacillus iranensis]
MMLKIKSLNAYYGDLQAIRDVSLEVGHGEIVALLGVNASGKSTTVRAISGLIDRMEGEIYYNKELINDIPPNQRTEMGLIQVPEGRQLFPFLTVRENLEMGAFTKEARSKLNENLERVFALFPEMKNKEKQLAGTMSGGEQQMCAIGRGLMSNPRLIMLDEPTLGLAPLIVKRIFGIIEEFRAMRITVLLIEQNVKQSLKIADRAYMLSNGKIIKEGSSSELMNSDDVVQGYLGV